MENEKISRRSFLLDLVLGGSGVILGLASAFVAFQYLLPPKRAMDSSGTSVPVCNATDVPEGGSKELLFNERPTLIIMVDGKLLAFSSKCTHLGCLVKWDKEKKILVCPCHNGFFDLDGNVISGPPPKPLPKYKVALKDEKIYLGE